MFERRGRWPSVGLDAAEMAVPEIYHQISFHLPDLKVTLSLSKLSENGSFYTIKILHKECRLAGAAEGQPKPCFNVLRCGEKASLETADLLFDQYKDILMLFFMVADFSA